jgi:hypothetical protein
MGAMISTRDLSLLPDVDRLKAALQSMAMLDAILCPEWQFRYYSFNSRWAISQQMGSMRNGSGDEFFALFSAAGCFLKGSAHESPMTPYRDQPKKLWPGVLDAVPPEFADCLKEPAFRMDATTFCVWRGCGDPGWQRRPIEYPSGADPDGSNYLLTPLDGEPETYQAWAEGYYEQSVSLAAVRKVYLHQPLTEELVSVLNPKTSIEQLKPDIAEINYP